MLRRERVKRTKKEKTGREKSTGEFGANPTTKRAVVRPESTTNTKSIPKQRKKNKHAFPKKRK